MLYLHFHITFRIVHLLQTYQFPLAMFSECGMKSVLHFHFTTDVLCPDSFPVVVYLFTLSLMRTDTMCMCLRFMSSCSQTI